ncbi:MAG: thermonuclease family protein [Candidatus Poribacteria bacterium]
MLETVYPSRSVEADGREASSFTKNLRLGESVYLRFDTENQDRYGRLLAYLYRAPDGLFVNLEVVRQGYGHAYTRFPFKHMELFRNYENQARIAGKGLWGDAVRIVNPQVDERSGSTRQIETIVYVTRTSKKYHRDG